MRSGVKAGAATTDLRDPYTVWVRSRPAFQLNLLVINVSELKAVAASSLQMGYTGERDK